MGIKNQKNDIYKKIKKFFPLEYKNNYLGDYIN